MNEEEVPHQLDWLFTAEEPPEHQVEPENTIQEVHDEPEDPTQEVQEEALNEPKFTRWGCPIKDSSY